MVCAASGVVRAEAHPETRVLGAWAHQRVDPRVSKDAVDTAKAAPRTDAARTPADAGDAGYSKDLKARHVNMIAIGARLAPDSSSRRRPTPHRGTRAGDRLPRLRSSPSSSCAPLGELVLYRPSSGSFVSYAREFLGEKGAYVAGWMYFLNWSTTGIADITAIALYTHYWSFFTDIPQWVLALIALAVVLAVNLISVKIFGEMEFWFAIVKVATLVSFMLVGIFLLATHHDVAVRSPAWASSRTTAVCSRTGSCRSSW